MKKKIKEVFNTMKKKIKEVFNIKKCGEAIKGTFANPAKRKSLFLYFSIVVALVVLSFSVYTVYGQKFSKKLTPKQVEGTLQKYADENLSNTDFSVEEVTSIPGESLYQVKVKVNGEEYTSFVTKSGKYLFPASVSLTNYVTK